MDSIHTCLVHVFNHMFLVFKHKYTHFYLYIYSKNINNITKITLPNELDLPTCLTWEKLQKQKSVANTRTSFSTWPYSWQLTFFTKSTFKITFASPSNSMSKMLTFFANTMALRQAKAFKANEVSFEGQFGW